MENLNKKFIWTNLKVFLQKENAKWFINLSKYMDSKKLFDNNVLSSMIPLHLSLKRKPYRSLHISNDQRE